MRQSEGLSVFLFRRPSSFSECVIRLVSSTQNFSKAGRIIYPLPEDPVLAFWQYVAELKYDGRSVLGSYRSI